MKKAFLTLLVLALVASMIPGCGSERKKRKRRFSSDPNEALIERMIVAMDDLTAELKGVTDADSAQAAAPKVAQLVAKAMEIQAEGEATFEELDEETKNALEEKYAEKMDASSAALDAEMMRVLADPELLVPLSEALAPFLGGDEIDVRDLPDVPTGDADVTSTEAYQSGATVIEAALGVIYELTSSLAAVEDERSAQLAGPRIEGLVARFEAMTEQLEDMEDQWDYATDTALKARYEGDIETSVEAMMMQLERITDDPELFEPLRGPLTPVLDEFGIDAPPHANYVPDDNAVIPPSSNVSGSLSYDDAAAMIEEVLAVMDSLDSALALATDAQSAQAVAPRVQALVTEMESLEARFDAMSDAVDEATEDALEAEYSDAVDAAFESVFAQLERVAADPEVYAPLAGALDQVMDEFGIEPAAATGPSYTDGAMDIANAATIAKAEAVVEEMLSTLEELNTVLATVTDGPSAAAAAPQVELLLGEVNDVSDRGDAVFNNMDQASQDAIEAKYATELETVMTEFMEQMMRISMDPELSEPLQAAFESME